MLGMSFAVENTVILLLAALAFISLVRALSQEVVSRSAFPPKFVFGTASSAYQYEGAASEDGRGPSIWDTFAEQKKNIADESNGNVANDQYHRYKEDIELMFEMGMDSYRFSISWSRVIPDGSGRINQLGLEYYNNLIDGLLQKGIQPFVTLYHWDLPQALQDAYGGWLSPRIVDDFAKFAETCFRAFGDRVKHWVTFNEPNVFIPAGYNSGTFPPQRCSEYIRNCSSGNSATEPYIGAHNVLLSHAAAVAIYRKKYQENQRGSIGIVVSVSWYVPFSNSPQDAQAVQRALEFYVGWFLDPIVFGDYPLSMRLRVGDRLPSFTEAQRILVRSSVDFVGINYYSTNYVADGGSDPTADRKDFWSDMKCRITGVRDGVLIGPRAASSWLYIVPCGIYYAVNYVKEKYKNPIMYITENGVDEVNNISLPRKDALRDHTRIHYHKDHIVYLAKVIREGADVQGYFAWSLLDDFEWTYGYTVRFGLYYVDYKTLERYPKASVNWFKRFLSQ